MAGWTQTPGGQVVWTSDLELVTHDGELVTGTDQGGWHAFEVAKTASVGAWAQDATWDASLIEDLPGAAGWSQDATWEALGQSAEDVTAEATFDQSASWLASSSQLAVGTATWEQTAAWDAEAEHVLSLAFEAAWSQDATWSAEASQAQEAEDVTGTGEWSQTATWAGIGTGGAETLPSSPRIRRRGPPAIQIAAIASFSQGSEWQAFMDVDRSPVDVQDLVLAGVL